MGTLHTLLGVFHRDCDCKSNLGGNKRIHGSRWHLCLKPGLFSTGCFSLQPPSRPSLSSFYLYIFFCCNVNHLCNYKIMTCVLKNIDFGIFIFAGALFIEMIATAFIRGGRHNTHTSLMTTFRKWKC